jgi:hypothetical protein
VIPEKFYFWKMNVFYSLLRSILILILLSITFSTLFAQYYIIGQDPASIKWKQINTTYFKIIYPDGYQKKALEYANLLEFSRTAISSGYLQQNKKVQIVLHNRTVTSNAIVSPAPLHADFFEMPDQTTYAQTWAKQLTLHEYRHFVQMQKLDQGFTKALKYAFGDQAIGGVMGVFLPFWFIEGDAVYCETIFSKSGRGRSPDFTMDLKAQIIDKKTYPYDKALFGSFKNYVPDHYTLGYNLVVNGNIKYGSRLWNNALNNTARKPYTLVPFSGSIKNITGTGKVGYYNNTLKEQKKQWELSDTSKIDPSFINPNNCKHFTNYRFMVPLADGNILVEKSGIDDINRFIIVDPDGIERKIFTPGYNFMESLSANDSLVCWNEKTFDPRWANQNFSVIKIHNYKSHKTKQLTHRSRLFSPALANSSEKLVAVNVTENNNYSLQIIDVSTGNLIQEISTSENLFFMHPKWSNDDKHIVSTVLGENGKSIILINTQNGSYKILLPFGYFDISRPALHGNHLVYTGAYDGTSNLYMFNLTSKETYKLTNVRFGVSDAAFSLDGNSLYFALYTSNGYRISNIPIKTHNAKVELSGLRTNYLINKLKPANNFVIDDTIIPSTVYSESKYSKIGNIFNIHSWGLAAVDLNNYDFQPGVNILTQNILSTAYGSLGYYYDPNEKAGKTKLNFEYAGWYPVINTEFDYGLRRTNYVDTNNLQQELKWHETNITLRLSLPLNLTKGVWLMGLTPYTSVTQKFLNKIGDSPVEFTEDQFASLTYGIFAYTQYKRSPKDIFPKWGFKTDIIFRHTPFSSSISKIYGWGETFYFPGIVAHHGIRIYSAYQHKQKGNYNYSNIISTPRGYSGINMNDMISLKSEYALPIIYPDLNLEAIAYLKRVTAHVYFDYVTGKNHNGINQNFSSAGLEIYSDWHFLSLIPNIKLGLRSNYRFFDKNINFEFLYGFSIN